MCCISLLSSLNNASQKPQVKKDRKNESMRKKKVTPQSLVGYNSQNKIANGISY